MSTQNSGAERIRRAILEAEQPALLPFFTAGHPVRMSSIRFLSSLPRRAEVVEIGVPFSDPMADGVTIQRASEAALANGATLDWILQQLEAHGDPGVPLVLMSYANPLLAYGIDKLAQRCSRCHVGGLIVPDLPWRNQATFGKLLDRHGIALVQMVTPATPEARMRTLCEGSGGFVYAVTGTGVTGGERLVSQDMTAYMRKVGRVFRAARLRRLRRPQRRPGRGAGRRGPRRNRGLGRGRLPGARQRTPAPSCAAFAPSTPGKKGILPSRRAGTPALPAAQLRGRASSMRTNPEAPATQPSQSGSVSSPNSRAPAISRAAPVD